MPVANEECANGYYEQQEDGDGLLPPAAQPQQRKTRGQQREGIERHQRLVQAQRTAGSLYLSRHGVVIEFRLLPLGRVGQHKAVDIVAARLRNPRTEQPEREGSQESAQRPESGQYQEHALGVTDDALGQR